MAAFRRAVGLMMAPLFPWREYPAETGHGNRPLIKKGKTNIRENVAIWHARTLHRSFANRVYLHKNPFFPQKQWFEPRFLWLQTTKKKARPRGSRHYLFSRPKEYCGWRPIGTSQYFLPLKPYIATVAWNMRPEARTVLIKSHLFPSSCSRVKGIGPDIKRRCFEVARKSP